VDENEAIVNKVEGKGKAEIEFTQASEDIDASD